MSYPKIVSIRKSSFLLEPAIIEVKAYPTTIDKLLTRELAIQYLRALRIVRRKANKLITDFLSKKISEYELKSEYLRLAQEAEDMIHATLALVSFGDLIEDLKDSIEIIEKIIDYICLNQNELNSFSIYLLRNIVHHNLSKIYNYKNALKVIRRSIRERLIELQTLMKVFRDRSRNQLRSGFSKRYENIITSYVQYRQAFTELGVIQMSMNIGLTGFYDELLKLFGELMRVECLRAQLHAGELSKEEYDNQMKKTLESLLEIRNDIIYKMSNFEKIKGNIQNNREILQKILEPKALKKLRKMIYISEKYIEKINKIIQQLETYGI